MGAESLSQLRGLLPDSEIEALGAILADMEEAASSPQKLRQWEREGARREAERAWAERQLRGLRGQAMEDGDPWL